MLVWIKDLSKRSCYSRHGLVIPKTEKQVEMSESMYKTLKSDPLVKTIVQGSKKIETEKKEAAKKEDQAPIVIEKAKEEVKKKRKSRNK